LDRPLFADPNITDLLQGEHPKSFLSLSVNISKTVADTATIND